MCRRTSRLLAALDWLHRLEFVDMIRLDPSSLPVEPEAALRGMPMRTRDGRVLIGFEAVRRALAQTPVGCLLAWVMYLPVADRVCARAYGWIAANRTRDACTFDSQDKHWQQRASAEVSMPAER